MRNEPSTCRLCADCQRSCKQLSGAVVVNCPHYVRVPSQRAIPEMAHRTGAGETRRGEWPNDQL